jgi:hypothetical protein
MSAAGFARESTAARTVIANEIGGDMLLARDLWRKAIRAAALRWSAQSKTVAPAFGLDAAHPLDTQRYPNAVLAVPAMFAPSPAALSLSMAADIMRSFPWGVPMPAAVRRSLDHKAQSTS